METCGGFRFWVWPPATPHWQRPSTTSPGTHKNPVSRARALELAWYFTSYGRKWGVDPWLAVSVACQESIFRDRPARVKVRRCRTVVRDGVATRRCRRVWAGERGMMQMIPGYSKEAFFACKGRRWDDVEELQDTETSICVGLWMMARRKRKVRWRSSKGLSFQSKGIRRRWVPHYAPCSRRQRRFCRHGNRRLCARYWWIGSYNWGSHKVLCGRISRTVDFAGYPIRVLRRYKHIVRKFRQDQAEVSGIKAPAGGGEKLDLSSSPAWAQAPSSTAPDETRAQESGAQREQRAPASGEGVETSCVSPQVGSQSSTK